MEARAARMAGLHVVVGALASRNLVMEDRDDHARFQVEVGAIPARRKGRQILHSADAALVRHEHGWRSRTGNKIPGTSDPPAAQQPGVSPNRVATAGRYRLASEVMIGRRRGAEAGRERRVWLSVVSFQLSVIHVVADTTKYESRAGGFQTLHVASPALCDRRHRRAS